MEVEFLFLTEEQQAKKLVWIPAGRETIDIQVLLLLIIQCSVRYPPASESSCLGFQRSITSTCYFDNGSLQEKSKIKHLENLCMQGCVFDTLKIQKRLEWVQWKAIKMVRTGAHSCEKRPREWVLFSLKTWRGNLIADPQSI